MTTLYFPAWSDLGMGNLTEGTRFSWENELYQIERYRYYFDGDVFQERQEDGGNDGEAPLLYPVGVNLVKMLTIAQSDSIFGEWDDLPVQFSLRNDDVMEDGDVDAIDLAHSILEEGGVATLWEQELDRNVLGGAAMKISPSLNKGSHIRWSRIERSNFFPIWDPDDPDTLLEAYIVYPMTAEQAKAKYNYDAENDIVHRVEKWTPTEYENRIDNHVIKTYSGRNPWGIVPIVYTPRMRFSNWWGDALTPDIIPAQDDLNMRLADISDAINYNAHPIRWGYNLNRDFSAKNFPLDANAFWYLGRSFRADQKPEVGILEARNAVAPAAFEYIKFLYDWSRTSVFAPPIAFGEDSGGGQRSGVTLEIRMWPLIKSLRRSRMYLHDSLRKALFISGLILKQKNFSDVPVSAVQSLLNNRIRPRFHPVMPRDQAAIVDEVVKLFSTDPPNISLETSQKILGRGSGEVKRIKDMLSDEELYKPGAEIDQTGIPD